MDFPANNALKSGYILEFSDEFNGTALDQTKWFPYMLPHWSSLEAAAARLELGGGVLKLQIATDQQPWRAGADRASNVQTAHYSGAKGTQLGQFRYDADLKVTADIETVNHYTPHFGYFETRLKAVPIVGYHVALWMIGFDEAQSGEIRIFEIHGGNISTTQSRIDYGVLAWSDPQLVDECFEDVLPIDASEFHVYALEWTPTQIDFFVDNVKLRTIHQSLNYPMQFMLGVYERPYEVLEGERAPFPRVCEVDYFRGYRPVDESSKGLQPDPSDTLRS